MANAPIAWVEEYTPLLGQRLIERLLTYNDLERVFQDEDMPAALTFYRMLAVHEGFRRLYVQAGMARCHLWAEEMVLIGDGKKPTAEHLQFNGEVRQDSKERILRDQLRVLARARAIGALQQRVPGQVRKAREEVEAEWSLGPEEELEEQQKTKDGRRQARELARWLAQQKERLGTDSLQVVISLLDAPDQFELPATANREAVVSEEEPAP